MNPTMPSATGTAVKENKFVPSLFIEEDKIAIIKIEDVIVAGTEYFIIPNNSGISAIPATATPVTNRCTVFSHNRCQREENHKMPYTLFSRLKIIASRYTDTRNNTKVNKLITMTLAMSNCFPTNRCREQDCYCFTLKLLNNHVR